MSLHVVVMGVSGCGKTTIAQHLAVDLDLTFAEGDDHHPAANVEKMSSGQPLTDEDRWPWLEALADWTRRQQGSTVLTCSALKRSYRDVLREPAPDSTFFVHLHGDLELMSRRMARREHFMPTSLLESQFDTLERLAPDEDGVVIDVEPSIPQVVNEAIRAVRSRLD